MGLGGAGGSFTFPTDVTGVLANVTIVQESGPSGGFVTLYPGDVAAVPNASTLNPSTAIAFNGWGMGIPTSGPNAARRARRPAGHAVWRHRRAAGGVRPAEPQMADDL